MPRQILNPLAQLPVFPDAGMAQVEAHLLKMMFERVGRAAPFSAIHDTRQLIQSVLIEAKRLADFARSRTVTIRNDVGRHCCAELSIPMIDVLDGLLPLVAARQVEIDVRPLAALF